MAAPAASSAAASGSKRALPGAAAERRVQPRHFHFGLNLAAATADDADADVAAVDATADATSRPSAVRLYRDAIGCVFQFLRRGEVVTALQVSHGWLAAAKSMRSLQLKIPLPEMPIDMLARSTMSRHLFSIGCVDARASLSADSLRVLALNMPQLRELTCTMPLAPAPLFFPAALRKLDLDVPDHCGPADANAALQSISLLPLLEELTIKLQSLDSQVSFAPLVALPLLRTLGVWTQSDACRLSDAQLDQLCVLPHLQKLELDITTTGLRRLLRPPHQLQWQKIPLPFPFDDEAGALLPQFPSLTEFGHLVTCSRFDWLRGLPNLTHVDLSFNDAEDAQGVIHVTAGRTESLLAGLQCCTNIEILTLRFCADLSATHLTDLLPRLPQLRELWLYSIRVDSLSFLAQPPMIAQLRVLRLRYCELLPLTELRHVLSLRGLQTLSLKDSFNEPMDSHCRSLYTPPSVLLPQLRSFIFRSHMDDDNESDSEDEDELAENYDGGDE